jgi:hypothetical protein
LPGWQQFASRHGGDDNQVVAVALEHNGAERARPFVEQAGVTFPVLVDEEGVSSGLFGFKAVPNGVLVEANGTIRWAKYGGFSIENADDLDTVRRFFAGEEIESRAQPNAAYELSEDDSREITRLMGEGHQLAAEGEVSRAVELWRRALHKDPENLVIRKQIWSAEHPEKFHPTIDWEWQKGQLRREREEEIAQGVCGPDGCPIPALS